MVSLRPLRIMTILASANIGTGSYSKGTLLDVSAKMFVTLSIAQTPSSALNVTTAANTSALIRGFKLLRTRA
jgi:hypothetical protein